MLSLRYKRRLIDIKIKIYGGEANVGGHGPTLVFENYCIVLDPDYESLHSLEARFAL